MFNEEKALLQKKILEQIASKFSPLLNSIRIPLGILLLDRVNKRHSAQDQLITLTSNFIFLIKSFFNKFKFRSISSINENFIFIVDHDRKKFINVFLNIMLEVNTKEVFVITCNHSIYKYLNQEGLKNIIYIDNLSILTIKNLILASKILAEVQIIDPNFSIMEKFSIFIHILKVLSYEECYQQILSKNSESLLTLCDANLNEQVATRVANQKQMETFTLQHGIPNSLWFPIVSDKLLVWNEHYKSIFINMYGVEKSKIKVIGNPLFETNRKIKRKESIFTITYIVTNWGEVENKELFRAFSKLSKITGILLQIKLRPNSSLSMLSLYKSWVDESDFINIKIIHEEGINDVLVRTDLLITFNSGVAIEGMAFEIPTILLDIFEYINLKSYVSHYSDCLNVKDEKELLVMVNRIIDDKEYFSFLKEKVKRAKVKYYIEKSSRRVIHDIASLITHNN
jgi:hypothetical protein